MTKAPPLHRMRAAALWHFSYKVLQGISSSGITHPVLLLSCFSLSKGGWTFENETQKPTCTKMFANFENGYVRSVSWRKKANQHSPPTHPMLS